MRKYNKKRELAYYIGKRVGLMEAIAAYYDYHGMNDKTISEVKCIKDLYYKARRDEVEHEVKDL